MEGQTRFYPQQQPNLNSTRDITNMQHRYVNNICKEEMFSIKAYHYSYYTQTHLYC